MCIKHYSKPPLIKFRCLKCFTDLQCELTTPSFGPVYWIRRIPYHRDIGGRAWCSNSYKCLDNNLFIRTLSIQPHFEEKSHKPTKCSLCSSPAVAIYYFSHGCVAYPDMTVQSLCIHHENKATPLGSMELLKDLRVYNNV